MSIKFLPKNLHSLTITLVLNFHKTLKKTMNIRHSTQLKLSAKFIKRCELRAYRY